MTGHIKNASFKLAESLGRAVHEAQLSNAEAAQIFAVALGMYVIKIGVTENDAQAFEFLEQFMQDLTRMLRDVDEMTITIRREEKQ